MQEQRPIIHVATMRPRPVSEDPRDWIAIGPEHPISNAEEAIRQSAEAFGFEARFADQIVGKPLDTTMALRIDAARNADAVLALSLEDSSWVPAQSEGGYDGRNAAWLEADQAYVSHRPLAMVALTPRDSAPDELAMRYRSALEKACQGRTFAVADLGDLPAAIERAVVGLRERLDEGARQDDEPVRSSGEATSKAEELADSVAQEAAESVSEERPIEREFVGTWHGAELTVGSAGSPLDLHGDTTVVFFDHQGRWGSVASAVVDHASSDDADQYRFVFDEFVGSAADTQLVEAGTLLLVRVRSTTKRYTTRETSIAAFDAALRAADEGGVASLVVPLEDEATFGEEPARVAPFTEAWLRRAARRPRFQNLGWVTLAVRDASLGEVAAAAGRAIDAADDPDYRPQPFANDLPQGPDLLGVAGEVQALAEAIALKDAEPPLVVGVLGGWGWGKSFVLHLLEDRLRDIRSWKLREARPPQDGEGGDDAEFPYVGHLYTVRFDAWTYAKSNLMASLMRTVLVQLDEQVALERNLVDRLGKSLRVDTEVWRTLATMDAESRRRFLGEELAVDAVDGKKKDEASLWAQLEHLRTKERGLLRGAEERLAGRRERLDVELADREEAAREELRRRHCWDAFDQVWKRVRALLGAKAAEIVEKARTTSGEDPPTFEELEKKRPTFDRLRAGTSREFLALAVLALAVFAVPYLLQLEATEKLTTGLVSIVTGALSILAWVRARAEAAQKFLDDYHERLDALRDGRVEEERQVVEVARARVEMAAADDLRSLEEEVEKRRRRVGLSAKGRSLVELLQERIEGKAYDRRLGLLHQVQEDLAELTEALLPRRRTAEHAALFPRGEPRVVLVIDDLDRCPPKRVVEVLEAVQLLVRTRLFVVVIAMDVRYVTRALEKVYEGILVRDGAPSGLDYIEKIVQVPYRVRPMAPEALGNFLGVHMQLGQDGPPEPVVEEDHDDAGMGEEAAAPEPVPDQTVVTPTQQAPSKMMVTRARPPSAPEPQVVDSDSAAPEPAEELAAELEPRLVPLEPLPTEALQFDAAELAALRDACVDAQISPRSAKRLVNVFKLVKIVWHRREVLRDPESGTKRAMALLLALAARYPVVLRELLPALEGEFAVLESGVDGEEHIEALAEFLVQECANGIERLEKTDALKDEWERCQQILEGSACLGKGLTLAEFGAENARLVSSFSFVSDPLWERQAELEEPPVASEV